jgi:formate hydrogenlyase subunit 6/NADH:ubiquinone oxidoreductase subunit I
MKTIDIGRLADLAEALGGAGYRVVAPVGEGGVVRLREWTKGVALALDAVPVNSAKDFLFPRSEVVARFKKEDGGFSSAAVERSAPKTAVLCARPCDAAALSALDAVFNWDYRDGAYNARREAVSVVSLACAKADANCFCTSVGGAPDGVAGADAILKPADGGKRLVFEPLTPKGRTLEEAAGGILAEGAAAADAPPALPRRFNSEAVGRWFAANFDSPFWKEAALGCLGCGACAYACPVCHCFDLQDETDREGVRRLRNWDSCGFGLFTLHASGHNPRPDQSARWRQRVLHKFSIYPQKFKTLACTGCGRCARLCQAGMAIAETCERIEALGR